MAMVQGCKVLLLQPSARMCNACVVILLYVYFLLSSVA